MKRDERLDFARGIAVLLVIVLHTAVLTPGGERFPRLVALLGRGSTGVQLFFVLSGLLVYRSWIRASTTGRPYRIYSAKRLAKIYPLYCVFLLANVLVWALFLPGSAGEPAFRRFVSSENFTSWNVLSHLLFLQGVQPRHLHTLLDGSWSIVNEVYFYALLPLLASYFKDTREWIWGYFASLSLAIVCFIVIGMTPFNIDQFKYYNFLSQLPCFIVGVILARLMDDSTTCSVVRSNSGIIAAFALVLAVAAIHSDLKPVGYHHLYSLAFAMLLLATFDRMQGIASNAAYALLARVGEQSYAMFFLHLLWLKILTYAESSRGVELSFPLLLAVNFAVTMLVCYQLSSLLFNRLDRYVVGLVNRILAREARPGAPGRSATH